VTSNENSTNAPRPEADWLARDLVAIRRAVELEAERFRSIHASADLRRRNYHTVVAEFFWRSYNLAAGAQKVLAAHLRTPLMVIQRALFEATVSAMYLAHHPDPESEAVIYRVCVLSRELELTPLTQAEIAERQAALASFPADLVAEADRRRSGRGWTGNSWKKLGDEVGFSDYSVYEYLSEYAHGKLGDHVRLDRSGSVVRIMFGDPFAPLEHDYAANFARRMLFHSFDALRFAYEWEQVNLDTSDPMKWFVTMEARFSDPPFGA
jgi:hypothetical protein